MNKITYFFYNIFTLLIFPVILIFFILQLIFKPKYLKSHLQRLGFILPKIRCGNKKRIWIHAVSVGEIASCEKIINLLNESGYCVLLSTTTLTGYIKAQKMYENVTLFFYPLDIFFAVNRFVKRINPDIFILVEMEFWPLMMHKLKQKHIPIYVVSARIGDIEFRNMKIFRRFFTTIFNMVNAFYAQSENQARRINHFYKGDNVKIYGSLKFDVAPKKNEYKIEKFLPDNRLICIASTHKGEEEIILTIFSKVLKSYPGYSLVIAPRHTHRAGEVTRICKKLDLSYSLRTDGEKCSAQVFVVDTIGELMGVFANCDFVIMGGSFSKKVGGHNIIEPAMNKKACICGLHMQNFKDITLSFAEENAIIQTPVSKLEEKITYALDNAEKIKAMGEKAYNLILKNRGVSRKIFDDIFNLNKQKIKL